LFEDWDLLIRAGELTKFYFINKVTARYNYWCNLQISFQPSHEVLRNAALKIYTKHREKVPHGFDSFFRMRDISLLRRSLSWQEEQTNKWWKTAQGYKAKNEDLMKKLSWQEEQTNKWWKTTQEQAGEIAWLSQSMEVYQVVLRHFDRLMPPGSKRRLLMGRLLGRNIHGKT
jgi:hypothetical protein